MKIKKVLTNKVESRFLYFIIIIIFVSLSLNLFINYQHYQNNYNSVNSSNYELYQAINEKGTLSIAIEREAYYKDLEILINGQVAKTINNEKQISIHVRDGDIVQINGSMYSDEIIVFINYLSENIRYPHSNKKVIINGNIKTLCQIRI